MPIQDIVEKYRELDATEKDLIFFLWYSVLVLAVLFISYIHIEFLPCFGIVFGYFIARVYIFKQEIKEREKEK